MYTKPPLTGPRHTAPVHLHVDTGLLPLGGGDSARARHFEGHPGWAADPTRTIILNVQPYRCQIWETSAGVNRELMVGWPEVK